MSGRAVVLAVVLAAAVAGQEVPSWARPIESRLRRRSLTSDGAARPLAGLVAEIAAAGDVSIVLDGQAAPGLEPGRTEIALDRGRVRLDEALEAIEKATGLARGYAASAIVFSTADGLRRFPAAAPDPGDRRKGIDRTLLGRWHRERIESLRLERATLDDLRGVLAGEHGIETILALDLPEADPAAWAGLDLRGLRATEVLALGTALFDRGFLCVDGVVVITASTDPDPATVDASRMQARDLPAFLRPAFADAMRRDLLVSERGRIRWVGLLGDRRLKHGGSVEHTLLSADGEWLVSAADDETVRIWDVRTGAEVQSLRHEQGSLDGVSAIALSADRSRLYTAGWFNGIHVWDTATGGRITTLGDIHLGDDLALAGDWVAVATSYDGVRVHDLATGKEVLEIAAPNGTRVGAAAGSRLVVARADGRLEMWHVGRGRRVDFVRQRPPPIAGLEVGPAGEFLATADEDGTIRLWKAEPLECLRTVATYPRGSLPLSLAFGRDGQAIAAASADPNDDDERVVLWDAARPDRRILEFPYEGIGLGAVAAATRRNVVAAGIDNFLTVWDFDQPISGSFDVRTGAPDESVFPGRIVLQGLLPYGRRLGHTAAHHLIGSPDGTRLLASYPSVGGAPQGNWLIEAAARSAARLPPADGDRRLFRRHLVFDPDGARLHGDGRRRVGRVESTCVDSWRIEGDGLVADRRVALGPVAEVGTVLALTPDGRLALTGTEIRTGVDAGDIPFLLLWDLTTGRRLARLPVEADLTPEERAQTDLRHAAAFSPDGRMLATAQLGDGRVLLWNVETGRLLRAIEIPPESEYLDHQKIGLREIHWHPSGERLVTTGWADEVHVCDIATGTLLRTLEPHRDRILSVAAFSPDGRYLVTGGRDNRLVLFETERYREVDRIRIDGTPSSLVFAGSELWIGCANHTVAVYSLTDE